MRKRTNDVAEFAIWFNRQRGLADHFGSRELSKTMGQAAALKRDGYELPIVTKVITAMIAYGIEVRTPYAVRWQSPDRNKSWYEYSKPPLPPLWDSFGVSIQESGELRARSV